MTPEVPPEAEVVDGRLELSAPHEPAKPVMGPFGPPFAATGTPITDEDVRRMLEAVRKRR